MKQSYPKSYVAWDLETTGLSPKDDRIVEIGAIVVKDGQPILKKEWLLKHEGLVIPQQAIDVHGITNEEMNEKGIDPAQALKEFMTLFNIYGHNNLTHNGINFDIPFLEAELGRHDLGNYSEGRIQRILEGAVDSAVLYKAQELQEVQGEEESFMHFANRVMNQRVYGLRFNVKYLTDKFGITISGDLHRALVDVEATHEIYKKIIEN